jgi:hypothetical protein
MTPYNTSAPAVSSVLADQNRCEHIATRRAWSGFLSILDECSASLVASVS